MEGWFIQKTIQISQISLCPTSIARQCRTNPWPAVPDWPWCRNANAVLKQLTNGNNADAVLTFFPAFRHLVMILSTSYIKGTPAAAVYGRAGAYYFPPPAVGSAWCIPNHVHNVFLMQLVRYRNAQKVECRNQSGIELRGPSPIPECSGTWLRCGIPMQSALASIPVPGYA